MCVTREATHDNAWDRCKCRGAAWLAPDLLAGFVLVPVRMPCSEFEIRTGDTMVRVTIVAGWSTLRTLGTAKAGYPMLDVLTYTAQQTSERTGRCRGTFRLNRRVAFTGKPGILLINAGRRWQR
jgi:hypothetical protein